MRAKRPARVLVLLLAVSLLPTVAALAHHGPTVGDVVATAQGLGMTCQPSASQVDCFGPPAALNRSPLTVIRPASGPLLDVYTRVNAHSNGVHDFLVEDRVWFTSIHATGCQDPGSVRKFLDTVAAQFEQSETGGTYGPVVVGECSMVGSLVLSRLNYWEVTSKTLPSAFPTPTPTPSPTPTATPSPTPTPTATPTPSPTTRPATPTAQPTATATESASVSASASASASPSASQAESPSASASPEQSVAGITFSPEPSVPAGAPHGGVGGWPGSVPGTGDVSGKPGDVAGSALAALLLLAVMGFIGELFNNTMETNYYRVTGWWKESWLGRIGRGLSAMLGGGAK